MRASRLVALLLHIQEKGGCTAPELADLLEVSVRTIYRDIEALQAAGVPLWTETGPRGGVRILEGWRSTLDGLTADEASALFLAGAPMAAAELGLATVLTAAQSKVLATLPPELHSRAARVRERFHVDAPGWFYHQEELPHLATVADAVWTARRLDVRYGQGDAPAARRLDPLGLVLKAGVWYLVAAHRHEPRTYRVSRIRSASRRDEPVERPEGFDLTAWWTQSSLEFDRSMLRDRVRLRLDEGARRTLLHVTDPAAAEAALAEAGPPDADGWCEIDLAVESEHVAVFQLTALGAGVEILEPRSARASFAEIGRAMAAHNAG